MPENHQLSDRELEILRLVATGASNKDIAGELVISVNTVKVHLRNIYSKLDVSSRTEATFFAVQSGLVPSPLLADSTGTAVDEDNPNTALQDGATKHEWEQKRNLLIGLLIVLSVVAVILSALVGVTWWQQRQQNLEVPLTAQTLEEDRWEKRAAMISPRSNFATAVVDGEIYAIGGVTEQGITGRVERFNVEADTWEYISDMPQAAADIQAVTIGGKVFVPGGRLENGELSRQLITYDPLENLWQKAAPLPVALSGYALVAYEGKLYLFGGWDGTEYVSVVWQYDPSLNEWEAFSPMPTARGLAGAGVSGGEIHVVGGYDGENVLDTHEVYIPEQDRPGGNPWVTLAPLPDERYHSRLVSVVEIIHLIGGTNDIGNNLHSFKYFSQNDEWERFLIPMADSWVDFGAEIVGEHIYIFGGQVGSQQIDQNYSYRAVYSIMVPILP